MERPVLLNKKGVSLIEVMFALVILLIASLSLVQTAMLGISMNLRSTLRDEAVSVADQKMSQLMSLPFTYTATAALLSETTGTEGTQETAVTKNFRGFSAEFTPFRKITDINPDTKQITIKVAWIYKGKDYHHSITTIMRKQ